MCGSWRAGSPDTGEGGNKMPSVSKKQHGLMGICSNPMGRQHMKMSGKPCPPLSVAKEFVKADKGKKFSK